MLLSQIIINSTYFIIPTLVYASIISFIYKGNIDLKQKILFSFSVILISSALKTVLPSTCFTFLNIFNILLIFIGSIVIFNIDTFTTLIFTALCSSISFLTNILSLNIISFSEHYMIYNSLMFLIVIPFFYAINLKDFVYNLKSLASNISEIDLITLIVTLSYNFSALNNSKLAYTILFIQICIILYILKSIIRKTVLAKVGAAVKSINIEYKKLKGIVDDIRVFKHDYGNTLCSIGGYISLNDMTGLKEYYNKLTLELNNTNNMQKINTYTINEPSIYNLLLSKYNKIMQSRLKFDFYSTINYKNLTISPYDFSKILGIFLDNAIDAANLSNEKEISLTCRKNKNKDFLITIKNSYTNKDVDIEKIYLKGYSSKSVKSGLGLWEVSKIIKSHPNISLNTEKDENYFTQTLVISA